MEAGPQATWQGTARLSWKTRRMDCGSPDSVLPLASGYWSETHILVSFRLSILPAYPWPTSIATWGCSSAWLGYYLPSRSAYLEYSPACSLYTTAALSQSGKQVLFDEFWQLITYFPLLIHVIGQPWVQGFWVMVILQYFKSHSDNIDIYRSNCCY